MKYHLLFWISLLYATFVQAETLPFVGERQFWFEGYDSPRVIRYIRIDKNADTKILYDYNGLEERYLGKYKSVICDEDSCIKILTAKKVALVDKQAKVLKECGRNNKKACISPLFEILYQTNF